MIQRSLQSLLIAIAMFSSGLSSSPALAATPTQGLLDDSSVVAKPDAELPSDKLRDQRATQPAQIGNPLWAIPLRTLSVTRERPIFSPSRRAAAPAILGTREVTPVAPRPNLDAAPQQPLLSLVGTVSSERESIGVFLEQSTKSIVRLRMDQSYSGWILRSVRPREATLQKGSEIIVLALPAPGMR